MTAKVLKAFILALAPLLTLPLSGNAGDDVFVVRLRSADITPTSMGIRKFLANVTASPEQRRTAKTWIRQLGSPYYDERITAMEKLKHRRIALAPELLAGQTNANSEIALRCTRLLHGHDTELQDTLFIAVLETIVRRRYRGLLVPISRVFEHSQSPDVFRAAIDAVVVTTTKADLPTLRDWLKSTHTAKQILAIHAIGQHSVAAMPDMAAFLSHDDSTIQLAAAIAIARKTPRECLSTCLHLLSADEAWVRADAARLLRDVTGQKFGYWAYAEPVRRGDGIKKWSDWLANTVSSKSLRPLPVSWRTRNWLGQRLVCRWEGDKLEEFDRHQRSNLLIPGFEYPWGCWGTPDGHRLVVDSDLTMVLELDSAGAVVWKDKNLPGHPTCVQRLKNGNTLLALSDPHQLVEYDSDRQMVWQFPLKRRATTAQRLANGETLVNLQHADRVAMIDSAGSIRTVIEGLNNPYTAEMLDNGNILVCETDADRVGEFNASGKLVWSLKQLRNPAQAQRLPNGNTMVSDDRGLIEFSPTGQTVEHWPLWVPSFDGPEPDRVRFHFY